MNGNVYPLDKINPTMGAMFPETVEWKKQWNLSLLRKKCGGQRASGEGNKTQFREFVRRLVDPPAAAAAALRHGNQHCNRRNVFERPWGRRERHRLRVVALDLFSQGLTGTISPVIGNLTFPRSLNQSFNILQGEIPPTIGSLTRLRLIDLSTNMLTGVIPRNISRCTSLDTMHINSNKGTRGSIPDEIGNMPSLSYLVLFNNSITGTIPSSLGNLSRLIELSLSLNYLEGSIPSSIGNNPYLTFLQLSVNNISGLLPPSLYNLSSLNYFYTADNNLHGRLPIDLGKSFPSIQEIFIGGNRFSGALPQSITNLSKLQMLYVENNSFAGIVPSRLGRLQNLEVLILEDNMLEANNEEEWEHIASLTNCSRLQKLIIGWNKFAGKLPSSLANLSTNLQWLRTTSNNISGLIPSDIGNLGRLEYLDFRDNLLTGVIPESIGKLTLGSFLKA
nr:receptor kinase-like protein Xa21 [Setaria viridis]